MKRRLLCMRSLILRKREYGDSLSEEAEWVSTDQIRYIKTEYTKKKGSYWVYGTEDGSEYLDCNSIDKTSALFETTLDGFIKTDRGVIANLNLLPGIDEDLQLLIFDERTRVTIAPARFLLVKDSLLKLINRFKK